MKLLQTLDSIFDRLSAVAGALVFAQAPEFFQQYTQRLAGHLGELKRQVNLMENLAQQSSKTLEQYIQKFLVSTDPDIAGQGGVMEEVVHRYQDFHVALKALVEASPFTRPFQFLLHMDTQLFYDTVSVYKPAVAFTPEGVVYVVVGAFLGYGCYHGIKLTINKISTLFSGNEHTRETSTGRSTADQ